ncbi:hypothetical protein FB382_000263 [Nocardioides ginsengisegetis]|uniref:Uncharacterized protein n=1 Tax=Nocardioides ginsengisegetis TaxID=661491 RepID=A0A7W3P808_9ACTN|nr:hypothetical protein [Nocardioides ginsengisegetis]MBA8801972.1 hypothetical protein [Nocardioides ginsengisegetis]
MSELDEFDRDDALLARLRAIDPASALPPADPSRVARLLEDTMATDRTEDLHNDVHHYEPPETREDGTHGRGLLTWIVAAAAVVLIAGVGVFGFLRHDSGNEVPSAGGDPTVTQLSAPAATSGKCMVPSARILSTQAIAFDGTVTDISADLVTLVPTHFYAGDATDLVKVEADPEVMQALVGAVKFQDGGRYLVSATDGRVTVCGLSGPYDARLAALYAEAFPG